MVATLPLAQLGPRLTTLAEAALRPRVGGKFLFVENEKYHVRGVTYGTFRPSDERGDYPEHAEVARDFAAMVARGINTVRVYTVPPRWLLDTAHEYGLRVIVGLPWEQHVTFLDDRQRMLDIERRVRDGVRACAGHPAVLGFLIGNEIPAPIVRWYGAGRVAGFLRRLYQAAKTEDPEALVSYANYPSTEYLDLPFVDFVCFNIYLESTERLDEYLARLHNLAGDRPVIIGEIGLDSRRNGEDRQAHVLSSQLRTAYGAGCAGVVLFAWTDEWHRGGHDVDDWDFGLVDRARRPKPALAAVQEAFAEVPFPRDTQWPPVSVVVCSYNGERTIRDCLEGLAALEYPSFEVVVVDDGSTDRTPIIAREYDVRLIRTENRGLGSARNTGLEAATHDLVAYTDDDARPDPHWLHYLAWAFMHSEHAAVGGPNLAPPGDGPVAECVANAPGGPIHVLIDDRLAEHIPGCNMAFRRECLEAIGGFDPRYRAAGDDVDICWRLQDQDWTIGFSPAAMVWHHRRNSVGAYWKQQQGYGMAEALLEEKWPEKYNSGGHLSWRGRLYSKGLTLPLLPLGGRIYQGTWGSAPFQSVYSPAPGLLRSLPLMPEWFLLVVSLTGLSLLGVLWPPLLAGLPLLGLAVAATVAQAAFTASKVTFSGEPPRRCWRRRALVALLHLIQPLARLRGRLARGLTPWRRRGAGFWLPLPRTSAVWSERWRSTHDWLGTIEAKLKQQGAVVFRGSDFDHWDLEVRGGLFGAARVLMAVEEHGGGKQLARFRVWPRPKAPASMLLLSLIALATAATLDGAWLAAAILGLGCLLLLARTAAECGAAASIERAIHLQSKGRSLELSDRAVRASGRKRSAAGSAR